MSVKRSEKQLSSKGRFFPILNLIALSLGSNSVKSLRVTKIFKEIKSEGVRVDLESKDGF